MAKSRLKSGFYPPPGLSGRVVLSLEKYENPGHQKAVSGFGFTPSSSYPQELKITQTLANLIGDTAVETAYFDGDVGAVKDTVDGAKGVGTFDETVDAMKNEDYGRARNTLDSGVPAPVPAAP